MEAEMRNVEANISVRNRKQNQTNKQKIKSWFFGKSNKIGKCLAKLSKVVK